MLPAFIATSNKAPRAIVSVCVESASAPVVFDVIENVSFPLAALILNTTVDDVAAVVTRHHKFDNVLGD